MCVYTDTFYYWRMIALRQCGGFCPVCMLVVCKTPQTKAHQASPAMGFSRQECCSGLPSPPPGHLPNPGLLHCTQILYQLSHMGSPVSAIHQCKSVIITYVYIYTHTYLHPHSTPLRCHSTSGWAPFLCSSSSLLLSIYLTHDSIYVSILFSQFASLSPSPTVSTSPFSMPMSSFILYK